MNRVSLLHRNVLLGVMFAFCAIGVAGTAVAQNSPSVENQNRPGPPAAIPPTGGGLAPTPFDSADTLFNRFDANRRGYLTKDQVQGLDGFLFEAADLNHDGKLSADEFSKAWNDYSRNK